MLRSNANKFRFHRITGRILAMMLIACMAAAAAGGCAGPGNDPNETKKPDVTEVPAEPTPEQTPVPWQTDDQGRRLAGSDITATVKRDGTPKKYFTISFDDGITQDERIIEIYKKYNFKGGTFFIDTGLFGANWTWVGQTLGDPTLTHIRWTEEEFKTGIYDGYDVESHTYDHPSLKNLGPSKVVDEIMTDTENIYNLTGIYPTGMAWPGGDTEYTSATIEIVRDRTTAKFARATTSTYKFKLPRYWLKWQPTCGITDPNLFKYAQKFLDTECTEDMLFYVWGHGYELDYSKKWEDLDKLIKMMTEAEDVICVSNADFYWLFKDEVPAWK